MESGGKYLVYWQRWYVLFLFSYLSTIQCTVWLTFGVIPDLAKSQLGLNANDVDLLAAYGPIFFFPGVFLASGRGLRFVAIALAALMLACAGLRALVHSPEQVWMLHIAHALNGLGGSLVLTPPPQLALAWFPAGERATATSVSLIANSVGSAVGFLLIPFLTNGLSVQRMLQIVSGAQAFGGVMLLVYFPQGPPTPPSAAAALAAESEARAVLRDTQAQALTTGKRGLGMGEEGSIQFQGGSIKAPLLSDDMDALDEGGINGGAVRPTGQHQDRDRDWDKDGLYRNQIHIQNRSLNDAFAPQLSPSGALVPGAGTAAAAAATITQGPSSSESKSQHESAVQYAADTAEAESIMGGQSSSRLDACQVMRLWLVLLRRQNFLLIALAMGISTGFYSAWTSLLGVLLGGDPWDFDQSSAVHGAGSLARSVAWLGFLSTITGCVGGLLVGPWLDRTRSYRFTMLLFFFCSSVAFVAFALVVFKVVPGTHALVTALASVGSFFLSAVTPAAVELAAELTYPVPESVSNGLIQVIFNAGTLVMQLVGLTGILAKDPAVLNGLLPAATVACGLMTLGTSQNLRRLALDTAAGAVSGEGKSDGGSGGGGNGVGKDKDAKILNGELVLGGATGLGNEEAGMLTRRPP